MNLFRLNQVCEINPPKDIKNLSGMEISFVPMEAVSTEGRVDTSRSISGDKVKSYSVFKNRDVLFAKITPCMENGKGGIVNNLKNGYGAGSTEFIVIRPDETKVTSEWIKMFLSQTSFRYDCRNNMTGSAGQKRVPPKFLASKTIPVPPLEDQHRIVTRIEELFSQLDSGVETLKKTKEQLKVYRQAVLKELICEGELSELRYCIDDMGQGWSPKCIRTPVLNNDEWAVITTTSIQPMKFIYSENKKLPDSLEPRMKHVIEVGDILITRAGPRVRCGVCCMVRQTKSKLLNCDKVYRIKVNKRLIIPEYLEIVLNSPEFQKEVSFCKTGGNDSGVNLTQERFLSIKIPVPTINKQKEKVEEAESRLSVCDSIEKTIDTALQEAEALRQSILKQAFEGGL